MTNSVEERGDLCAPDPNSALLWYPSVAQAGLSGREHLLKASNLYSKADFRVGLYSISLMNRLERNRLLCPELKLPVLMFLCFS